jgi:acetate---CoA ligase (ADP-forming)
MSSTVSPHLRADLDGVFRPKSVAIYGISERTSQRIAENMTVPGVPFYGINPTKTEACGVRCYPTIGDCPEVPEMVVMGVGHGRIEAALDDVLSVEGVRAIITPGLGNEAGEDGPEVSRRVSERVRAAGIPMIGPNCMGVATPGHPSPWIGSLHPTFVPGPVATVAHSGSIGEILVSLGPRIGFRTVVSAGNEGAKRADGDGYVVVTDIADMVAYFAEDEDTRVVGLFVETVRRPEAFEAALAKLAEAGKVAIVLKVGTSAMGRQAALTHTGALVGDDRSFSAMLRYYNAIRVDDFGTWLEHLEVFSRRTPPRGRRIGAVTNSGGEGEYFADKAEDAGIPLQPFSEGLRARILEEFPNFRGVEHVGNPVDCWAIDDDRVVFPRIFELLAESGEFDVLVSDIDHSQWLHGGERELAANIADDLRAACAGGEIFPCVITVTTADPPIEDIRWAREHDIPVLKGSLPGLRALAARVAFAPRAIPSRAVDPAPPLEGRGALPEIDSAAIAASYGVPYVRAERCATADEAVAAAERIGYPVVVKVDNVAHKARVGGVALGLADAGGVRDAAERMGGRVIVAEQVSGGAEVLVGMVRDRDYGATVVVGIGGALAEALDLVTASLAPLDREGARNLVRSLPALDRLIGGEVPEGLIDAVVAVSLLAAEHPEISEIDINPLLVSPERAVALDCLITLGDREEHEA